MLGIPFLCICSHISVARGLNIREEQGVVGLQEDRSMLAVQGPKVMIPTGSPSHVVGTAQHRRS